MGQLLIYRETVTENRFHVLLQEQWRQGRVIEYEDYKDLERR